MSYPTMIKDTLAQGKPVVGINPLLIGQDGTDYTSGTDAFIPMTNGKKVVTRFDNQRTDDSGVTWSSLAPNTPNDIENKTSYYLPSSNVRTYIAPYTYSPTLPQIEPMEVINVGSHVIGTNAHSVYKGANIANSIGYIATGNGAKNLVSKVVEDAVIGVADYTTQTVIGQTVTQNVTTVWHNVQSTNANPGTLGVIYLRVGSTYTALASYGDIDFGNTANWKAIGFTTSAPTHNTINLSSGSNGAKALPVQMRAEDNEIWNGYIVQELVDNTTDFGDNNEFNLLTNGTDTDLNGNTIRVKVVGYPTGVYYE